MDIKELGIFVDDKLVKKQVEWPVFVDGEQKTQKATIYVKQASHIVMAEVIKEAGDSADTTSAYIAAYICDKDGKRLFTYEQAKSLKPEVGMPLYRAAIDQFVGMRDPKKD